MDPVMKAWTVFFDMCGGGYEKTPFKLIFIEGQEDAAIKVFKERFDVNPRACSCSCCGPDFAIDTIDREEGTPLTQEAFEVMQNYPCEDVIFIPAAA